MTSGPGNVPAAGSGVAHGAVLGQPVCSAMSSPALPVLKGQARGLAAVARNAGMGLRSCLSDLGVRPGGLLRVPNDWPRR